MHESEEPPEETDCLTDEERMDLYSGHDHRHDLGRDYEGHL